MENYNKIRKNIEKVKKCVFCKTPFVGWPVECDNDCGTIECDQCNKIYYVTSKGDIKEGHNPKCGDSEDYE